MRKLVWAACGYGAALVLAEYLLPGGWLLPAAGLAILLALVARFLPWRGRKIALLTLLAAGVGFGWFWGYRTLFVNPAEAFAGEERSVCVRIAEEPRYYDDYASVEVRCVDDAVPNVRMLIYDYAGNFGELRPGDFAEMPLKLLSAGTYYREDSDTYLSRGILLRGYLKAPCRVTGRAKLAWLYFPQTIARAVREQAMACFSPRTAPLMTALLTGDKTEYYKDDALVSQMKTAGFTHIIAVSGMHMSFLMGLLNLLTGRRRRTAALGIPLVIVFMAMTGFTPSVTRAGIMQILLMIAPLFRRENDAPTSLAAAGLAMTLCNPIMIASVSFQLSFAAMAGLILVTPELYDRMTRDEKGALRLPKGIGGKVLQGVCAALSASVGAIVFTTPITALTFGFVPLYGVLTNLLCLWAMSTAFLLGYPICLLGALWAPVGQFFGRALSILPAYAIWMVRRISRLPMAAICTRHNLGAWWLVLTYAVFLLALVFRRGKRLRPVLPVCISLFALLLTSWFPLRLPEGSMLFTAVDVGQGQSLAALTERATVVIDCGSTGAAENAGDAMADYLLRQGRSRVDLLVMTHFHADHANGVIRLMSRVPVKRIAYPVDCEENAYMDAILAQCQANGTELLEITENTDAALDGLTLRLYAPLGSEDVNEHCLLIRGDWGDEEFLVTGDAGGGVERELTGFYDLGDLELLVVGHHGSKYSTDAALLDAITPEMAFISVGAGNSYGHPTAEVLERLEERNIQVRRTDLEGTVSYTLERKHGKEG